MNNSNQSFQLTPIKILALGFVLLAIQLSHESAHWVTCKVLGYECYLQLNRSGSITPFRVEWHAAAVSAAGPLLTIVTALLAFFLSAFKKYQSWYPVLLACFAHRLLASIFGVTAMYNDEAMISLWLGWMPHLLPIIVTGLLLLLVIQASRRLGYGLRLNLKLLGVIYLFFAGIIALDLALR